MVERGGASSYKNRYQPDLSQKAEESFSFILSSSKEKQNFRGCLLKEGKGLEIWGI